MTDTTEKINEIIGRMNLVIGKTNEAYDFIGEIIKAGRIVNEKINIVAIAGFVWLLGLSIALVWAVNNGL